MSPSDLNVSNLLLSLATAPLLLAIVASKAVAETIKDIGQASEELFRGDRLPILKISASDRASQDRPDE